jgi:hypothetical protein
LIINSALRRLTAPNAAPAVRRVVLGYFKRAGIDLKPEHEVHNVVHAISMITSTRGIMLFAVPLARIKIGGHMLWQGRHPIAPDAQKVDFIADESYEVTPLAQGFADLLNKVASAGYSPWAINSPQSIFGKAFAPFGLKEATNFKEYDLVYLRGNLLFWGARNIDGRGFDTDQNRPTNLQIPLVRK